MRWIVTLAAAAMLTAAPVHAAPSPALRHVLPEPDAHGCTHLSAVVKYNAEQGYVSVTLTDVQASQVLTALSAPAELRQKIDTVQVAKYVPAKDRVHDAEKKAQLAQQFDGTVIVVVAGHGCFFGGMPASADVIASILSGQNS